MHNYQTHLRYECTIETDSMVEVKCEALQVFAALLDVVAKDTLAVIHLFTLLIESVLVTPKGSSKVFSLGGITIHFPIFHRNFN